MSGAKSMAGWGGTLLSRRTFLNAGVGASLLTKEMVGAAIRKVSTGMDVCNEPLELTYEDIGAALERLENIDNECFEAMCYYYPSWHKDVAHAKRVGRGESWTEWEEVASATPKLRCQKQPKHPSSGLVDIGQRSNFEKEIELATSANIKGFMFDWYFNQGEVFYNAPIDHGFLKAANRERLAFAILWVNSNSREWQYDYRRYNFDAMISYFAEKYAVEKNYVRVDGRPLFGIFDVKGLLGAIGQDKLIAAVDCMRERSLKAGLRGLYVLAVEGYGPETDLRSLGFDGATRYNTLFKGHSGAARYRDEALKTIGVWQEIYQTQKVDVFPSCPVGWDDTPRRGADAYIVVGRSANQYKVLLLAAKQFLRRIGQAQKLVFMSSWNEWSEGHYILPDEEYGARYLDVIRDVFECRGDRQR
jgi:hypothetical protein